jgi:hypothetical protein
MRHNVKSEPDRAALSREIGSTGGLGNGGSYGDNP